MSYPGYVKGKSLEQLRRGISAYAAHYKGGDGNSEVVSEAIDDKIVNGKSANLFSKEISAEVMRRLGE